MASRSPFLDPIDLIKANPDNLVGWAEIAAGLGHSERTVRRWRDHYALPVVKLGASPLLRMHRLDKWILEIDKLQRRLIREGTFPRRRGLGRRRR